MMESHYGNWNLFPFQICFVKGEKVAHLPPTFKSNKSSFYARGNVKMFVVAMSQDKLNKFSILLKSKFKYLYKNFAFIYFALKSIKSFSLARRELFTKASLTTPLLSKNTINSKFHSSLHSRSRDGNVSQVRVV